MSLAGWNETGRRMVDSVLKHWPASSLPVTLYAEGFIPPQNPAIDARPLPAWVDEFKAKWGAVPAHNGKRTSQYDYRFDAVKFAHKVGAYTDFGMSLADDEVMVVLDADTFTHAQVTQEWLEKLLPDHAYMAWLDRMSSHPECGFVMFRGSHGYHRNFMEALRNLYTTGDIFKLPETHDSFILQHMARAKAAHGKIPLPASLSGKGYRTSHPFINGPLGACMDHAKGPRKANGGSFKRDLIFPRTEPYWQGAR